MELIDENTEFVKTQSWLYFYFEYGKEQIAREI